MERSNRTVYLHPEIVVTNSDIARSRVIPGESPSQFGIDVQLTSAGAEKMRQATMSHLGKPENRCRHDRRRSVEDETSGDAALAQLVDKRLCGGQVKAIQTPCQVDRLYRLTRSVEFEQLLFLVLW